MNLLAFLPGITTQRFSRPDRYGVFFLGLCLGCCIWAHSGILASRGFAERFDFERDVVPIFQSKCIACHAAGIEKGDVSLATADHLRENGYLETDGDGRSPLLDLVESIDSEPPRMPPEGEPLTEQEVNVLRQWIEAGAPWPEGVRIREKPKADATWWSLQPLTTSEPPSRDAIPEDWSVSAIDRFVYNALAEKGLSPNESADRRVLIRRATYDLTGLPPTPEEIQAFLLDDSENAYEQLIDRLLDSPRYGERWGRHWLDVVRFGESNGYERNILINELWPFRDYVIRSINEDKPFDQFIREHLAGDAIGPDQPDVEIGTAFVVAGPYDNVGNQDAAKAAQIRADTIDEMIRASGEAFLGLTIGCARCHDHKFDPILQSDYYAWYATFAGIQHGSRQLATKETKRKREAYLKPLRAEKTAAVTKQTSVESEIESLIEANAESIAKSWTRPPVQRTLTEESFPPVQAKFIRLVSQGNDTAPQNQRTFGIDEFEVWTGESEPRNVALQESGAVASGESRKIDDFPGAYGPQKAIDGKFGERFLATGGRLTIEFSAVETIDRVVFSSARHEDKPDQRKFAFVCDYQIETSLDGTQWKTVATSGDREPVNDAHRKHRLRESVLTPQLRDDLAKARRQVRDLDQKIAAAPALQSVWVGKRKDGIETTGPFHVFVGGSPARKGDTVVPASLSAMKSTLADYRLPPDTSPGQKRLRLAEWVTSDQNALTARVLANRVWHYHFGTGIVSTPSDFGFMGQRPSHPELLDHLAGELIQGDWRLKSLHKTIMMSKTYRQSSRFREAAGEVDRAARLLWRFPPRRLSAEEIRDTFLSVAGKLDFKMGGPGFQLYRYLQDNVATYVPKQTHGPETYRRAVYHQNARASVVDLMTDFDQPDCAYSTPRRSNTTTPLQALTMMNHSFTSDMAAGLAQRVRAESETDEDAIRRLFEICFGRPPTTQEHADCLKFTQQHDLMPLCRVLLNSSELIFIR